MTRKAMQYAAAWGVITAGALAMLAIMVGAVALTIDPTWAVSVVVEALG